MINLLLLSHQYELLLKVFLWLTKKAFEKFKVAFKHDRSPVVFSPA